MTTTQVAGDSGDGDRTSSNAVESSHASRKRSASPDVTDTSAIKKPKTDSRSSLEKMPTELIINVLELVCVLLEVSL